MSKDLRINEHIRVRDVRLIDEEGGQLGVVPTIEAMRIARERGVDLVEVAPTAIPPVCRLMDYGRFKYEQEKKDREARKHQKTVLMKEVRLRPKTSVHDVDFKTKQIERFVEEGDKVKVTLRFRGREMVHPNVGRQLLEEVANRVKGIATVERMPLMEGNTMTMILTKSKTAMAATPDGQPAAIAQQPAPRPVQPAPGAAAPSRPAPVQNAAPQAAPAPAQNVAPPSTQAPAQHTVPPPTQAPAQNAAPPSPAPTQNAAPPPTPMPQAQRPENQDKTA